MRIGCRPLRDKLGKSLRQRGQRLRERQPTIQTTSAPREVYAQAIDVSAATTSALGHRTPHASPALGPAGEKTIAVDKSLQQALLGAVREPKEVRAFQRAIRQADSKAAAAEAFLLLTRTSGETVSAATLKVFTATLLERHAESQMGPRAFSEALADVTGGHDEANARWSETSLEERRCFAAFVCRSLARGAGRGTTFNKDVGLTVEGGDNEIVSLTEYQLRKRVAQEKMLPAPTDVLTDLVHLDVSWQVALRVLEYGRELRGSVVPTVEMNDRVMGLMTGYKTNGLGSRPWKAALALYQNALASGLDLTLTTHTHALDALWRSAESFHKAHNSVTEQHRQWILEKVLAVQSEVDRGGLQARLAGEEGCAYMESVIKATAAAGCWAKSLSLLLDLETSPQRTSRRFLVPTAESYIFAVVACYVAGRDAEASSLLKLFFSAGHTLRTLHPEVLLIYLQSARRHVASKAKVGEYVEQLLTDGHGLDRPCTVACLQLLSSARVATTRSKAELARIAFDLYDGSVWIQQPLARKIELQTVFRCCHLVDAHLPFARGHAVQSHAAASGVVAYVRLRLQTVFGADSAEVEWLDDTEVYTLAVTTDVQRALATYERQVSRRAPEKVKFLPIPLREVKHSLASALLRSCRAKYDIRESSESFALEEEDFHRNTQHELHELVDRCLRTCRSVFHNDANVPREVMAELLLLQAAASTDNTTRRQLATEALQHLSLGSANLISTRVLHLLSETLSVTTVHVETTVLEEHVRLRAKTLSELQGGPSTFEEIIQYEYV